MSSQFRLLLLLLLASACTPTTAFDLNSLLAALGGSVSAQPTGCPEYCHCSKLRAEDVMNRYLNNYLPHMGVRMNPKLESEARSTITFMTLWLGHMADIKCHLPAKERANISVMLQTSSLSFKALKVRCEAGASVVWDLAHFNAFINVLDIAGCDLQMAAGADSFPVPINLWILQLDRVPSTVAPSFDLTAATSMLAFSWTRSGLKTLPHHWTTTRLRSVIYINLAYNDLSSYNCQLTTTQLTALNLDHNNFTDLPECVLNGDKYTSFLSMRNNKVRSLNQLTRYQSVSENVTSETIHEVAVTSQTEKLMEPDPQLWYLDLSHNELTRLQPLKKIILLTGLDLRHNQITSMDPETFSLHPYLSWLDLSQNQLSVVPDGALINLVMMQHLNLSYNNLLTFNFDQSPLSSRVVDIDLRYNRLSYPPFADTGFVAPRLSRIRSAYNPFICDCTLNPFLRLMSAMNSNDGADWFGLGYWDNYDRDSDSLRQPYIDNTEMVCSHPRDMTNTPLFSLPFTKHCRLLRSCPVDCTCQLIRGGNKRVVVDCSNKPNFTDLPDEMPVVKEAPLVVFFNRSGLRRLDHRPYLRYMTELYADYNKISFVTSGAIEAMENISVLSLHNNLLRTLPAITQNLSMSSASNISLADNPWTCGCHDLWMPNWLKEHAPVVYDVNNTRCRWTGEMVANLTGEDLNCGIFSYVPLVMAMSFTLGLLIVVATLFIKYRLEVLVFLYTRFRIRPFDMYRYQLARPYLFDAFISFSQHDYEWVSNRLVDHLENREHPYKLCIHLRDFPAGAPIAESVAWAVTNSRCTLLVLTKHFLSSEWCRHELRAAHARLLKDRCTKLLVLVHGPLDARTLDRELLAYLRTHTFLRSEDKWFWDKLDYALPSPTSQPQHYIVPGPPRPAEGRLAEAYPYEAQPHIELDSLMVPSAMAAGDVSPKRGSAAVSCVSVPI